MSVSKRNLTLADGQVAATATEITAGPGDMARRVNVSFSNVGGAEETLVLTITRNSGTARRLRRVTLAANEQFEITGLPLNSTDSLKAATTNASSVDYMVSLAPDDAPLSSCVYDENGSPRHVSDILEQMIQLLG